MLASQAGLRLRSREDDGMRNFALGLLIGLLLIPIIAVLVSVTGVAPITANATPHSWESTVARKALDASLARAPRLQNPIQPTSESLSAGLKLFRRNCAGCHGTPVEPSPWGTTSFYPRVPQFGQQPPQRPDWQLYWVIKNGVRYTGMAAWDQLLPDHDVWTIVTFLSHLRDLPPDVAADWRGQQTSH